MHPIERLRFVARIGPEDPVTLAREAAGALLACAADPAELVVACRRLLDHQPASGPLWWLASLAVTAVDPHTAVGHALARLADDTTSMEVAAALAHGPPDVELVDAWALGEGGAFTAPGCPEAITAARGTGRTVWLVAGVGRVLPPVVWRAAVARIGRLQARGRPALIAPDDVDAVVGPSGLRPFADAVGACDCPVAPELLRTA